MASLPFVSTSLDSDQPLDATRSAKTKNLDDFNMPGGTSDSEFESALLPQGAPVEETNPLGHEVTHISGITLNLGQMLGSGIYSVPGVILNSVGSVGLLFLFWILAPIFCFAGASMYTELASMFPKRSGADVVYLEQAYPRPRLLVPVSFAVTTVLLSLSATNAIVFAQYFMSIFEIRDSPYMQTMIAIGVMTAAVIVVGLSTRWSLRVVNLVTGIKVICHLFIIGSGIVVLSGHTRITDPFTNFRDPWSGGTSNGNAIAVALVKTHSAFVGWHNVFNVLGEVHGPNPVRVVRSAAYNSIAIVTAVFLLTNVAYVAAVPREDIKHSGQLIAALYFERVFGRSWVARTLPAMVACSCVGNIIATTVGQARVIREVARQGLLPHPGFFASTKPFGTPLGPVVLKWTLTTLVLLVLPAKDAFNFIIDLASYPNMIFASAAAIGLWRLRRRRAEAGLPPTQFRASNTSVWLYLLSSLALLILPWFPPEKGRADVSFWYATYCVVGIAILLLCGLYYWVWIILLPRIGNYDIVEEVVNLQGGARATRLVKRRKGRSSPERDPLLAT